MAEIEAANSILNRDDANRNDPPTYARAWTTSENPVSSAAATEIRKVTGKFVRHVGRRINQAPLISGRGLRGISPGDRAQSFNLGGVESDSMLKGSRPRFLAGGI